MKKILFALAALFTITACTETTSSDKNHLRVATFNIRLDTPDDGANSWQNRKDSVYKFILENELDVIGFQEVLFNQYEDLKNNLSDYDFVSVGREDGAREGEAVTVAFNKHKFERLDDLTWWLADDYNEIGAVGWDAALPRIATGLQLKIKATDSVFTVVNTHLDHMGVEARKQGALLAACRLKDNADQGPLIIMGDFNFDSEEEIYSILVNHTMGLNDTHAIAEKKEGVDYTFQNFGNMDADNAAGKKIDYIFATKNVKVQRSYIPSSLLDSGLYLSDHNPIIVDLSF